MVVVQVVVWGRWRRKGEKRVLKAKIFYKTFQARLASEKDAKTTALFSEWDMMTNAPSPP